MGGDGGVIASNRRYMRGAGTANHTGDTASAAQRQQQQLDPAVWRQEAHRMLRHCYLSQQAFDANSVIVACPYGRLYLKEVALEALLQRKQQQQDGDNDNNHHRHTLQLGSHIRGLKDLRPVRFHWATTSSTNDDDNNNNNNTNKQQQLVPTCPITGRELNGQVPTFLIWPGKTSDQQQQLQPPNVLSENGCQMLPQLQEEYGVVKEKWRLAPPPAVLEQIQQEWQEKQLSSLLLQQQQEGKKKKKKSSKKNDKKRKRQEQAAAGTEEEDGANTKKEENKQQQPSSSSSQLQNVQVKKMKKNTTTTLTDAARARVSAAVQTNKVFSSLFTSTTTTSSSSSSSITARKEG